MNYDNYKVLYVAVDILGALISYALQTALSTIKLQKVISNVY